MKSPHRRAINCILLLLLSLTGCDATQGLAIAEGDAVETVMSPGMTIRARCVEGELAIHARGDRVRCFTWSGETRCVTMIARRERWNGSLGLYFPGPGDHWEPHDGITRCVAGEGQMHFANAAEAVGWLQSHTWLPLTYRNDGLAVGWIRVRGRQQLSVEVWQILIDGKKPTALPGASDEAIEVEFAAQQQEPIR